MGATLSICPQCPTPLAPIARAWSSLPSAFAFSLICWLYFSFSRNTLYLLLQANTLLGCVHAYGFNMTATLMAASLAQCLTNSESFLRDALGNSKEKSKETFPNSGVATGAFTTLEVKYSGKRRFCRKCKLFKPDRAHHCRTCNSCVLKMDHHCSWINTCVGYHNYKAFLLFLLYASMRYYSVLPHGVLVLV